MCRAKFELLQSRMDQEKLDGEYIQGMCRLWRKLRICITSSFVRLYCLLLILFVVSIIISPVKPCFVHEKFTSCNYLRGILNR